MAEKNKSKVNNPSVTRGHPFGALSAIPFPYGTLLPRFPFAMPLYGFYGSSCIPYPLKIMRKHQIAILKTQAEHLENIAGTIREFISEAEEDDKEKKE